MILSRRAGGLLGLVVVLGLLTAGRHIAEGQTEPEPTGIKGVLIFKNFSFLEEAPNDRRHFRNEGILQAEWTRRFAPWVSARLVGEARADDDDYANQFTFQIPETSTHRSHLGLKEAIVRFDRGPLTATLGKQFFSWGTADGYNPTDNINPYDYLDPLDAEKMGVWSAAAQLTLGPTNTTFVVIPVFTPSRTPLIKSRWVPPIHPAVIVDDRQIPDPDLDNVQFGARTRATVRGWDFSVSYFEGFEATPVIKESAFSLAPGLSLPRFTPVFSRMRVVGLDTSTTYRKFELHGEAAFKFVTRNGPRDRLQLIAGLNYAFDELNLRWLERITVILEYAREVTLRTHRGFSAADSAVENDVRLPNNAYSDALLGRVLFRFTDDTQLALSGTVDLSQTPNYFTRVAIAHRLSQSMQVDAGVDLFGGRRDTFWGRWGGNDRFFVFLKYFF